MSSNIRPEEFEARWHSNQRLLSMLFNVFNAIDCNAVHGQGYFMRYERGKISRWERYRFRVETADGGEGGDSGKTRNLAALSLLGPSLPSLLGPAWPRCARIERPSRFASSRRLLALLATHHL